MSDSVTHAAVAKKVYAMTATLTTSFVRQAASLKLLQPSNDQSALLNCATSTAFKVILQHQGLAPVIFTLLTAITCCAEAYSHIRDPSVKLAVALGLDPGQLAIYSGQQGTDSASAVAALQFALSHPLTEADEGLQKMPHFHTMTRSIAAKQRSKVRVPDVQQPELPLSFRMDKINTIEGILSGMKSRILGLEKNLVSQLDLKKQAGLISEESLIAPVSGNASLAMPPQQ